MSTKSATSLSTIVRMLDGVEEYSRSLEALRRRMRRHKPGSAAYHDLLPELSVQFDVLKLKIEHASQALEDYEDSLPEES